MTESDRNLSNEELAELDGFVLDENGRLHAEVLKYYMGGKPKDMDEDPL